jgi:hypothetical protein
VDFVKPARRALRVAGTLTAAVALLFALNGLALAQDGASAVSKPDELSTASKKKSKGLKFDMVLSQEAGAAGCAASAKASVTVKSSGSGAENLSIKATGLPKNTGFGLFVIQVPDSPFGISSYVGDLQSDKSGKASASFVGRFSIESFVVAPGVAAAPVVHTGTIPDAATNPTFRPVHTYHLGLWFASASSAAAAGCPNTQTAFNGNHTAGIQVLSTRTFPTTSGPLRGLTPAAD